MIIKYPTPVADRNSFLLCVCVVTGAARGLGYQFCQAFVDAGCTSLAILDLRLAEAAAAAKDFPVDVLPIACDVSSESSVKNAFAQIVDRFGKVDAVVASAGIVENWSALDYPADRIKLLYDVNVHGVFFTAREAARIMIPNGSGSIVLVGSMSSNIVNVPQLQTPYNASKAAVKHLATSLAVEWAKTGVRVNTLSPGYMATALTKAILDKDPALKKTWEELTPMGRLGNPEDLSGAIVYLCSDASKFTTGTEIRVDGGYCAI
ncbi:NAD-binding protein [Mycena floridula]|nr:NAD-binding protein [Mycena floridula]